jgi:two-component system sensor histidine kinase VanS
MAAYGFISWMIPKAYPHQIDLAQVELLAYEATQELRNTNDYTRAKALEENHRDLYGDSLELHIFDSDGNEINIEDEQTKTGAVISDYDSSKRTEIYSFSFAGNAEEYTLFYADGSQAINQTLEALNKIFPYLIITVLVISALAAFIYSKFITAPILKIDKASQKMTELDFSVRCETGRTDELGNVSKNLNALSEKLSITLESLENANTQLLEFFSTVSHELKTPITIVKGQLQGMIYEVGRYKDKGKYLAESLEVVNSLEKMVQELLDVSRMDTYGYTCNREPFDMVQLLKQCLITPEDLFIQRDMKLSYSLPESAVYKGDRQLLKKVFDNLIINALSYSPAGESIAVCMEQDGRYIRFSIENTGVHMENDDTSRLFEAFYRPDQSRSRQTGGSGLGLYIVKKILELHGANCEIQNSHNGVVFKIVF